MKDNRLLWKEIFEKVGYGRSLVNDEGEVWGFVVEGESDDRRPD